MDWAPTSIWLPLAASGFGLAAKAAANSPPLEAVELLTGICSANSPSCGMHSCLQISQAALSLTSSCCALKPGATVSGTGTFTAPASDYLSLFNRTGNSTSPFKGDVAELIFFGTQLSDGDVAKVGGYLAARYGLSVPFPALPDAYALWVASKFPSGSLSGTTAKTADPDHDGRVNLEEFFHASDPLQPDTAAATTQAELLQTSVGDFVMLKFRMANPLPEELTWQIETSQDLAFWSDSPGWLRRTLSNGPGWKIMQFRSASPIPTGINKAFYRLLLEAP